MEIKQLTVGKGKTTENNGEWTRVYYELTVEILPDEDINLSKANVEGLLDGWLSSNVSKRKLWNPDNIAWTKAEGQKGEYWRSDDVDCEDYKNLRRELEQSNGRLRKNGYFYWIFQNGVTIGRKKLDDTPVQRQPQQQMTLKTVDDVKSLFPEELANILSFELKEQYVIIHPRQFLGADNFARVAAIVKDANGHYISKGKESYFRIPVT